eukprot:SAG11_NODE_2864_length_2898_cov_1.328924_2_plen_37_part_00
MSIACGTSTAVDAAVPLGTAVRVSPVVITVCVCVCF